MDKVVHFEIPADNVERAKKFYKSIFGWAPKTAPGMDYTMFETGPTNPKTGMLKEKGFINGGLMKREGPFKGPVVIISVDDLAKSMKKIEKAGGKIVSPRQTVPGIGDVAYFEDLEGNVVGMIQPLTSA